MLGSRAGSRFFSFRRTWLSPLGGIALLVALPELVTSCSTSRLDVITLGESAVIGRDASPSPTTGGNMPDSSIRDATTSGTAGDASGSTGADARTTGTATAGNATSTATAGEGGSSTQGDARADSPDGAAPGWLHTDHAKIVDETGKEVRFRGINWYGLEANPPTLGGIWAEPLDQLMSYIAQLGFNIIRVPFSNQLFDGSLVPDTGVDPPVASALEMLKRVAASARAHGLMVVLVRNAGPAGASGPQTGTAWIDPPYTEDGWVADWQMLATAFASDSTVVGFDLAKEPHDPATWGDGSANDWALAATRAGNAVLANNPNVLIIVQGIQRSSDGQAYWQGGNLRDVLNHPIVLSKPDRVVYSTEDYAAGVYPQPWLVDSSMANGLPAGYPNNLPAVWDQFWGQTATTVPVVLSEFGTVLDPQQPAYGQWLTTVTAYVAQKDLGFFFSRFNVNSGTVGSLLIDWNQVDTAKMAYLSALLAARP